MNTSKLTNFTEWKESFWGKLEDKWDNFLGNRIYRFKQSCKSVIKWLPTIWKDRDYDDFFIFEILKKKLYFTAQLHIKNQRYVGWEIEVERMTTCIKLIDFIQNDHYEDLASVWLEEKYGRSKFEFVPIKDSNLNELKITHPNVLSGQYTEEEYIKDFREKMNEAYDKRERARRLLFNILNRHIEHWWG